MINNPDPTLHRQRQQQFIEHVDKLLDDERLRLDTTMGRRPIPTLGRRIRREDHETDLIRVMAEMDLPDRELQARMPTGQVMTITLWQPRWFVMKENIGTLKAVCVSPTRPLLSGESPTPLSLADSRKVIEQALNEDPDATRNGPLTLVVMSTSGFAQDAHELAERRADRTVVLVEPNEAGGWTVTGPTETRALVELFDPEPSEEKRQRVRAEIEQSKSELLSGALSADRIAGTTQLSLELVEAEMKAYAKEHLLIAKRLDGRMMLFREGSGITASAAGNGGSDMPFMQRLKHLFSRKDDPESRIAILSERRAVLAQQRDMAYEELGVLEKKEADLRQDFKNTESELAKRRLAGQIAQLRKDLVRRQQLVQMVEQQINVISTDLHNIELVKQGKAAALPSSDELASHAAAAEEVTAELQADAELAGSLESSAGTGMTDDVKAIYDELEEEARSDKAKEAPPVVVEEPPAPQAAPMRPAPAVAQRPERVAPEPIAPPPPAPPEKRSEPEPG